MQTHLKNPQSQLTDQPRRPELRIQRERVFDLTEELTGSTLAVAGGFEAVTCSTEKETYIPF